MSFWHCPRCDGHGTYWLREFNRWGRCLMCNANFGDKRSGAEIAESLSEEQRHHLKGLR